ncbi:deoxynucleoside monophosphate kinase [Microbacterium phage phiMiGM15]
MTLPLIGLTGYKRHGKDRTAAELETLAGYTPAAFADPLRDFVTAIDPIVDRWNDYPTGPERTLRYAEAVAENGYDLAKDAIPEVRGSLVAIGQAVRDNLGVKWGLNDLLGGRGLWVALAEKRILTALARRQHNHATNTVDPVWREHLVFTDVRMPDEADLIRKHGGVIVRVTRPDAPIPAADEVTEHALDDYDVDVVLTNDGTPEGLSASVSALLEKVRA